jgi:hypothetical protein
MCPIASCNWGAGSNAGVWALNLNNVRGNSNNNVGFRADSIPPQRRKLSHSGIKGDAFRRVVKATAKSECFCFFGRAGIRLEDLAI